AGASAHLPPGRSSSTGARGPRHGARPSGREGGALVARRIEALGERPDLLVREDARAGGLVLLGHAGSRILLEEPLSDRPSEETAEGAKRSVARGGSVLREQGALDVLGRNLTQELLAEHPIRASEVARVMLVPSRPRA